MEVAEEKQSVAKRFLSPSSSAAEPPAPRARKEVVDVEAPGNVLDAGSPPNSSGSHFDPPATPKEKLEEDSPILLALTALTLKMEMMSVQSDKIENKIGKMASKKDLDNKMENLVSTNDMGNFKNKKC